MSRIPGKSSSVVPNALKTELLQADKKLDQAQSTQAASEQALSEAHSHLQNARASVGVEASPAENVLYQKWPMLHADLASAWQKTKESLVGADGAKTHNPWDQSPEALRHELSSVARVREGIALLVADADPQLVEHLGGDSAALLQALSGVQKVEQNLDGLGELSKVLPGALDKLSKTVDQRAHQLKAGLQSVLTSQKNVSDFFDSPVLSTSGLEGKTLAEVLRSFADRVEHDPEQQLFVPQKGSGVSTAELAKRLRDAADVSEGDHGPHEVSNALLWPTYSKLEGGGRDFLWAMSQVNQRVGWHGEPFDPLS